MGFWSFPSKIKSGIEKNRCTLRYVQKNSFFGVWGHTGAQNMDFWSCSGLVKWRRGFELIFMRQTHIFVQVDPDPQGNLYWTYIDVFSWFLGALFCLKPTWNALFTPSSTHSMPNASKMVIFCPKVAYEVNFWSVIGKIKPRNDKNEWIGFSRGSGLRGCT